MSLGVIWGSRGAKTAKIAIFVRWSRGAAPHVVPIAPTFLLTLRRDSGEVSRRSESICGEIHRKMNFWGTPNFGVAPLGPLTPHISNFDIIVFGPLFYVTYQNLVLMR